MKHVAAPTQPVVALFLAAVLVLAGCNAGTVTGPAYDQADVMMVVENAGGKHESRNENGVTSDATLGGKHESRNENGATSDDALGGKHESRNENGAAGGKHESRNENGAAGGKHESRNENGATGG